MEQKLETEEPKCPECGARLKTVFCTAVDEEGTEIDYEGEVCPFGCRPDADYS